MNETNKYRVYLRGTSSKGGKMKSKIRECRKRYPKYLIHNKEQLLVSVMAHELYHHHQHKCGGKFSEIECETFAKKMVSIWTYGLF